MRVLISCGRPAKAPACPGVPVPVACLLIEAFKLAHIARSLLNFAPPPLPSQEWEDKVFYLLPYKDSGTCVVGQTDEIQMLLDDQLMKVGRGGCVVWWLPSVLLWAMECQLLPATSLQPAASLLPEPEHQTRLGGSSSCPVPAGVGLLGQGSWPW